MIVDNFVDYVKLTVKSGKGGRGSTHLRREKYVPKGGPDGGDGGDGGNIIVVGDSNLWTLQSFRFKKHFKAGNGGDGSGSKKSGLSGKNIFIKVPLGTIVKDSITEKTILEINEDKEEIILLRGGKGGLGNSHFKSPTNQTPRYSQSGLPGQELQITLELKILADVGLVGYPNVGKSTLLSVLSDAKPKIANYEFTTLKPNLGIVSMSDYRSFVMADIPGIIEGASEGRGLGHYFLRHIERNSILLYIIPVDSKNVKHDFEVLKKELIPECVEQVNEGSHIDLRIWSAGCSTGEEAYSILVSLMEYFGEEYWNITCGVLATDISSKSLSIASKGIYEAKKIDKLSLERILGFTEALQNGQLCFTEKIRKEANFQKLNLNSKTFPFKNKFHIIFCRNVLIYFNQKSRIAAENKILQSLENGGYIFLGDAEVFMSRDYELEQLGNGVYRKRL